MKRLILIMVISCITMGFVGCSKDNSSETNIPKENITTEENNQSKNTTKKKDEKLKDTYTLYNVDSLKEINDKDKIKLIDEIVQNTVNSIDDSVQACMDKSSLKNIKMERASFEAAYKNEKVFTYLNKSNTEEKILYKNIHFLANSNQLGTGVYNMVILQNGTSYRTFTSTYDYSKLFTDFS